MAEDILIERTESYAPIDIDKNEITVYVGTLNMEDACSLLNLELQRLRSKIDGFILTLSKVTSDSEKDNILLNLTSLRELGKDLCDDAWNIDNQSKEILESVEREVNFQLEKLESETDVTDETEE